MRIRFEFEQGDTWVTLAEVLQKAEAAYLKEVVATVQKRGQVASILGVSRRKLWQRLKLYALEDLPYSSPPPTIEA